METMVFKVFVVLAMVSIVCLNVLEISAAPTNPPPKCFSVKDFRILPPAAIYGLSKNQIGKHMDSYRVVRSHKTNS
ncbi:hypothetical protein G5I_00512 [Acromyrmex echinatior]|uniref:Transmembrane protein n=1 Tax=Acromyrmex echinatior TaxID=103372 RepID=F4W523_ACREC|nr:hypothetical protein G5I_00512 [Acromyrmex echinatior]